MVQQKRGIIKKVNDKVVVIKKLVNRKKRVGNVVVVRNMTFARPFNSLD